MSRYNSDAIDECCKEMLGHTHWAYMPTGDYQKVISSMFGNRHRSKSVEKIVIFYRYEEEDINDLYR
tara:strand:- start:338 stop:538 length:201 start_codon:yes stop_codon:yes gene_type:complete